MRVLDYTHHPTQDPQVDSKKPGSPRVLGGNEFGIHYVIEGEGCFRINETKYTLRHDSLFVTFPGDTYGFLVSGADQSFSYHEVRFELDDADEEIHNLLYDYVCDTRAFVLRNHARNMFLEMSTGFNSESPLLLKATQHRVLALLYSLVGDAQEPRNTAEAIEHVEKAIHFMRDHISGPLRLQQVCRELNITESHLIRLFKASQGVPPMKYFMRLKADAAANLLIETSMPVYQIADVLGFSNTGHFCRTFKKYIGASPSTYRNSYAMSFEAKERTYKKHLEDAYKVIQTMIDAVPDLLFYKDTNGVYLGCNDAFCAFTGLSKEDIIGRSDYEIHPAEKADFFISRDKMVFRYNRGFKNEEDLTFPNGQTRTYQVYKVPLHDSTGRTIGLVGVSRDVSNYVRVSHLRQPS